MSVQRRKLLCVICCVVFAVWSVDAALDTMARNLSDATRPRPDIVLVVVVKNADEESSQLHPEIIDTETKQVSESHEHAVGWSWASWIPEIIRGGAVHFWTGLRWLFAFFTARLATPLFRGRRRTLTQPVLISTTGSPRLAAMMPNETI